MFAILWLWVSGPPAGWSADGRAVIVRGCGWSERRDDLGHGQ
jgi:hypothetical protein